LSLQLDSFFRRLVAQINGIAGFVAAQEDADFFKELSYAGDPMAGRKLRIILVAENLSRFFTDKPRQRSSVSAE
jgi:hypothetical protein